MLFGLFDKMLKQGVARGNSHLRQLHILIKPSLTLLLSSKEYENHNPFFFDDLKPMKSGIYGHARAVAGYYKSRFGEAESEYLYVYDPLPWNSDLALGGEVVWENWDSIYHTNLIYTDLQY